MRMATTVGAIALMLAACAGHRVPVGGEAITYRLEATGFCRTCTSYTITLGPEG